MYGDAAYESVKHRDLLEKMGKGNALMHRGNKHHPMPESRKARNAETSRLRMPAEGVFGYMKRTLGYRKVRYMGLVKGEAELLLKSLIYNVVRSLNMRTAPARGIGPHRFRARFFRRDRRKTRPEASENSLSGRFGAEKRPQPAGIENRPALRTGPLVAEGQGETRPLSPPWERARACPGLEPGVRGPHKSMTKT